MYFLGTQKKVLWRVIMQIYVFPVTKTGKEKNEIGATK
jgi:hypothetical protein